MKSDWEKEFDKRIGWCTKCGAKFDGKSLKDFIRPFLQQARQEGIEEAIRKIEKGIEWNVGTVLYENGKKYFVYNAEHISKLLSELKKKEGIK